MKHPNDYSLMVFLIEDFFTSLSNFSEVKTVQVQYDKLQAMSMAVYDADNDLILTNSFASTFYLDFFPLMKFRTQSRQSEMVKG